MPLDSNKVALAIKTGLSIVCATCDYHWAAQDSGRNSCGQECGGPMAGDCFHLYRGPISNFSEWCFACGAQSEFGVRVGDNPRILGCCSTHINLVKDLKPVAKEATLVSVVDDGTEISADKIKDKPLTLKIRGG